MKVLKTAPVSDPVHFSELPHNVMSNVLHKLSYSTSVGLKALDKAFNKVVPLEPCLRRYVMDWSTRDLSSDLMTVCSCSATHSEDMMNNRNNCDCHRFKEIGLVSYLFVPQLWLNIFVQDDVRAATYLLNTPGMVSSGFEILDTVDYGAVRDYTVHLTSCNLAFIKSSDMWQTLDQFTKQQNPRKFNLQQRAFEIYAHRKQNHNDAAGAEKLLQDMVKAGVDAHILAVLTKESLSMMRVLMQQMNIETLKSNPIVKELSSLKVLVTTCCTRSARVMKHNLVIDVCHEVVRQCTSEFQDRVIEMLERVFMDQDMDERNDMNIHGETVLQVLYSVRPLNTVPSS